jgi:hypothetical protein
MRLKVQSYWESRPGDTVRVAPFLRRVVETTRWRGLWPRTDTPFVTWDERQRLDDESVAALVTRIRNDLGVHIGLWNGEPDDDHSGGLSLTVENFAFVGLSSPCIIELAATADAQAALRVLQVCVETWQPMFARATTRPLQKAQDYDAAGVGVHTYVRDRTRLPPLPTHVTVHPLGDGAVLTLPTPDTDPALQLRHLLRTSGAIPPKPPTMPVTALGQDPRP